MKVKNNKTVRIHMRISTELIKDFNTWWEGNNKCKLTTSEAIQKAIGLSATSKIHLLLSDHGLQEIYKAKYASQKTAVCARITVAEEDYLKNTLNEIRKHESSPKTTMTSIIVNAMIASLYIKNNNDFGAITYYIRQLNSGNKKGKQK